jgi:hypothetical protein
MAHSIAQQAVASMMRWIDASYSFQNIILVGGGAYLFKKAVKEAFPKHKILEVKDPLHANVRGFQIAGMNHAPKLFWGAATFSGRCVMDDAVSPSWRRSGCCSSWIGKTTAALRRPDPLQEGHQAHQPLAPPGARGCAGAVQPGCRWGAGLPVPMPAVGSGMPAAAFDMPSAADVFAAPLEK